MAQYALNPHRDPESLKAEMIRAGMDLNKPYRVMRYDHTTKVWIVEQ